MSAPFSSASQIGAWLSLAKTTESAACVATELAGMGAMGGLGGGPGLAFELLISAGTLSGCLIKMSAGIADLLTFASGQEPDAQRSDALYRMGDTVAEALDIMGRVEKWLAEHPELAQADVGLRVIRVATAARELQAAQKSKDSESARRILRASLDVVAAVKSLVDLLVQRWFELYDKKPPSPPAVPDSLADSAAKWTNVGGRGLGREPPSHSGSGGGLKQLAS